MNIIIVGCGRVGSKLAMLFSERRDDVAVIDVSPDSFMSLGRNFEGRTIVGVGFDEDVLLEAGIEECDVLVAVTDIDNTNLMISEVGRRLFDVPRVIARLYNPDRESAYLQLGLDYACGTTLVAEEMYSKVVAGHGNHVDTFGSFEVLRFALNLGSGSPEDAEGAEGSKGPESIRVSELERDHEIRIVAFERRDTGQSSIPTHDSVLHAGDIVLACVRVDLIERFKRYMLG
jgi:trk system potassium uptake protein TrkA